MYVKYYFWLFTNLVSYSFVYDLNNFVIEEERFLRFPPIYNEVYKFLECLFNDLFSR